MKAFLQVFVLLILAFRYAESGLRKFPRGFKFGVASAAYQIEGAWNVSDKGESIWDHFTHTNPSAIKGGTNADDTAMSYKYYMRDVLALRELGVDFYRFSLSWSRLLPTGFINETSDDGLRYYNSLIDALLARNIQPSVTLYHWDLPQNLQDIGGWLHPNISDYFLDYARFCFENFGDRVKTWLTINEPWEACILGYEKTVMAPGLGNPYSTYKCGHNFLKAHGKAYRLYDKKFRPKQKGRIGMTLTAIHNQPERETPEILKAVEIRNEFYMGWFLNPIFSAKGDYPKVMKDMIGQRSREQGLNKSKLPEFTREEIRMLKGSSDFFGINHYTTHIITKWTPRDLEVNFDNDHRTGTKTEWWWTNGASSWLKNTPWGFRKLLKYFKDKYDNPEIVVFENGWSTEDGHLQDNTRVEYIQSYMNFMLDAIELDGVNVTAYTIWCLVDSFEWDGGFQQVSGLYSTNFSDPRRRITPKESSKFYRQVVKSKKVKSVTKLPLTLALANDLRDLLTRVGKLVHIF